MHLFYITILYTTFQCFYPIMHIIMCTLIHYCKPHSKKSFRWNQGYYTTDDTLYPSWALSNVYIGSSNSCPNFCSGNGQCATSGCVCDQGYSPPMCLPTANRPTSFNDDFTNVQIDMLKWSEVYGGSVGTTCSLPGNGNNLYFSHAGIRKAVTVDLDMTLTMLVYATIVCLTCNYCTFQSSFIPSQYWYQFHCWLYSPTKCQ